LKTQAVAAISAFEALHRASGAVSHEAKLRLKPRRVSVPD
jgi:hypothetical protein